MSTNTMTDTNKQTKMKVRMLAQIGMLSAIATVLMLFEIPLPFAPAFYQIDLSEIPVMVGCLAMGPIAGMLIELAKIILNFVINGTITGGIGELANFLVGCALVMPAGIIYRRYKTKKGALIGMITGTAAMTVVGCLVNAYVLLPVYAKLFQMPIDALVEMGSKINPAITDLAGFVMFAVAPFNLVKGSIVSLIVFLIYKKISPIFKMSRI